MDLFNSGLNVGLKGTAGGGGNTSGTTGGGASEDENLDQLKEPVSSLQEDPITAPPPSLDEGIPDQDAPETPVLSDVEEKYLDDTQKDLIKKSRVQERERKQAEETENIYMIIGRAGEGLATERSGKAPSAFDVSLQAGGFASSFATVVPGLGNVGAFVIGGIVGGLGKALGILGQNKNPKYIDIVLDMYKKMFDKIPGASAEMVIHRGFGKTLRITGQNLYKEDITNLLLKLNEMLSEKLGTGKDEQNLRKLVQSARFISKPPEFTQPVLFFKNESRPEKQSAEEKLFAQASAPGQTATGSNNALLIGGGLTAILLLFLFR